MHVKGYEVHVSCDGKPLPEYCIAPEGDDGKTLACFIPSESGKKFSVQWRDHNGTNHSRFATKLDGRAVGGNRCPPGGKGGRWGVRVSPSLRQPFQFARLQTTDDDNALGMPSHASLGEIEVAVSRIRAEYRSVPHSWGKYQPVGAVHERSKKAGVHCVSLGEGCKVLPSATMTASAPLNPWEGDIGRFIFRYRPLELLRAQGIIPVDVKPVLPERKVRKRSSSSDVEDVLLPASRRAKRPRRDHNDEDRKEDRKEDVKPNISKFELSDEEGEDLEVLQSQLQQLQGKVNRAIRRRSSGVERAGRVKKEEPGTSGLVSGEVIDLTLDD